MIPKIIHFCWFGGNPLPPLALECIASWRKYLPDYEIWMWSEGPLNENETANSYENENLKADRVMAFDVNSIPYTAEAYKQRKYAFVSDYCRFVAIYQYGGIYFDTDVEVIKPMEDIIANGNFMGFEVDPDGENTPGKYAPRYCFAVNPGLGFGFENNHPFMREMIDCYNKIEHFELPIAPWGKTIVAHTTEQLCQKGLKNIQGRQVLDDIYIYPSAYFAPINAISGRLRITPNTHTIHRYMASWGEQKNKNTKDYIRHYLPEFVFLLFNKYKRKKYKIR